MIAGTQGGKTGFGPWWLKREIEERGAGDYLAVTATYDLFKLKMLPAMLKVFEGISGWGRYWGGDRLIELSDPTTDQFKAKKSTDPMWARIILRSADALGGLESATAKAAWLDEAGQDRFTLAAWRAIRRRLALHIGRVLITTTLYNLGWLKQQVIDPATDDPDKVLTLETLPAGAEIERTEVLGVSLIQYDSIANPSYPMSEYLEAQATMPPDEFAMFYRGRVAQLRALIYDCFSKEIHKVPAFPVPDHWPRVAGVDPMGASIGVLWLAFDPDKDQLHVYREYLEPFGVTTIEHAKNVAALSTRERIIKWIGGGPSERQARADWTGAGVFVDEPPITDVWVQINRVYALFKSVALVVHSSCPHLLSELGTYQRKQDREGELTELIKDKDRYHLLDALRYIVSWLTEPRETTEVIYNPLRMGPL
jgi:hypothetical protein